MAEEVVLDIIELEEIKEKEPKKKLDPEKVKKSEEFFASMADKRRHEKTLKEQGMETFFTAEKFIPALETDFEGHYPGNQNNPVLIPRKKGVRHVSRK